MRTSPYPSSEAILIWGTSLLCAGYFPAWLGKIHERFRTPARAFVVSMVVYCVLAKYPVEDLVNIYIWTRIATTLLTLLAAWRMRSKLPDAPRSFRIPGGTVGMMYVLIFPAILCAVKIAQSEDYVWKYAPLRRKFGGRSPVRSCSRIVDLQVYRVSSIVQRLIISTDSTGKSHKRRLFFLLSTPQRPAAGPFRPSSKNYSLPTIPVQACSD